jgi:hypothetical protein
VATLALAALLCAGEGLAAAAPVEAGPAQLVLGNTSVWRCYLVNRKPLVRVGKETQAVLLDSYAGVWMAPTKKRNLMPTMEPPPPPADWIAVDFDDRQWGSRRGPFFPSHHGHAYCKEVEDAGYVFFEGTYPSLAAICLRGKFMVADPAAAGDLRLSLAYRGGVVVYLNGQEIARANIPESEKPKGIEGLAEDYPRDVFVKAGGKLISWGFGDPQTCHAQLQQRVRRLDAVSIPARLLRKGVNVLAIEAHRTSYDPSIAGMGRGAKGYEINWCTVGVTRVELTASGAGVTANVARPAGFQVWNQELETRVEASDYGNPCEPLQPIRLTGARNGAFSAGAVVGSSEPLAALKAVAGTLTPCGAGVPPADSTARVPPADKTAGAASAPQVEVRYLLADKESNLPFEILSPECPAEITVSKPGGGALMPIWVTVKVPAGAKPGDYRGALKITAAGAEPVEVPIELRVVDWTLSASQDFASHVGLTQSPESVAMRYQVPLWSPAHWQLLERSFALLGQAGADDVFITALRRTHFGNEHGMIRWLRQPDGSLRPDFSIAEKYLDLAVKHLGKVPVVCLYCWEPYTGSLYGGGPANMGHKGMLYTIFDPARDKLEEAEGPKWGTPEVRTFWQPVFDGMRAMLRKRGMEDSLMLGVAGDWQPSKEAVEDLKAVAPGVKWVVQAHARADQLFGQPVGYLADVWSSPVAPDPAEKRLYGWKSPWLRTTFPREGSSTVMAIRTWSPLVQYRVALEGMSAAGLRGFGRMGADFWNVLSSPRSTYGNGLDILARYPESNWHQLYLGNSTSYVLAPGPAGALATARFEMIREGAQDMEARIFLEKALLDPEARGRLGEELAGRCQQLLDERVRAVLLGRTSWLLFDGGRQRRERLYALAAEASRKIPAEETVPVPR